MAELVRTVNFAETFAALRGTGVIKVTRKS